MTTEERYSEERMTANDRRFNDAEIQRAEARNVKAFAVIYRTGGTENFKWNRVGERYPDRQSAIKSTEELSKMGYPALVHDAKLLDSIGLPETFDASDNVNWSECFPANKVSA